MVADDRLDEPGFVITKSQCPQARACHFRALLIVIPEAHLAGFIHFTRLGLGNIVIKSRHEKQAAHRPVGSQRAGEQLAQLLPETAKMHHQRSIVQVVCGLGVELGCQGSQGFFEVSQGGQRVFPNIMYMRRALLHSLESRKFGQDLVYHAQQVKRPQSVFRLRSA